MSRTMVFSTSLSKPEAQLTKTTNEGEKVLMLAHERPSFWSNRMSIHATPRLSDSGRIGVESSVFGAVVAASTAAGGGA
jgi:predicted phage tail protein